MDEQTVVFLPGFLCDERLWQHQQESLSEVASCEVVDLRNRRNLQEMLAALDKVPVKKLHLVGFSMGAYVAQVFATQNPDRIGHLVLIGSTGTALPDAEIKTRLQMKTLLQKASFKGLSDRELRHYLHPDAYANPEIANVVREMAASNTSEMYLNQMMATLDRHDLRIQLNSLKFPMTLVGGVQDMITPKDKIEAFHKAVRRSKLHLIEGAGHFVPLEKPTELNQILLQTLSN
ncbi:MAG: alpha/beta hydrolase [Bdellovibrio sp.]|nr:alpha/beta hydrolase [Bdellovibrio sp.]